MERRIALFLLLPAFPALDPAEGFPDRGARGPYGREDKPNERCGTSLLPSLH